MTTGLRLVNLADLCQELIGPPRVTGFNLPAQGLLTNRGPIILYLVTGRSWQEPWNTAGGVRHLADVALQDAVTEGIVLEQLQWLLTRKQALSLLRCYVLNIISRAAKDIIIIIIIIIREYLMNVGVTSRLCL